MSVIQDSKSFLKRLRGHDFGFYAAAFYLFLEYVKPQVIYPFIDFLPWAQLTILAGLAYVVAKGQAKFQSTHLMLLTFMVVAIISSFLSYDSAASFNRLDYIVSWFVVVFFFTAAVKNIEQYKLLIILLFIFIFKMSFFGARTWALRGFSFASWGISGPIGFFQNSGELSLLMVVFAAMSFGFIIGHKNISKLYYLAPITAAMTVLAASSRGSQLALAVVIVLFAVRLGKLKIKNLLIVSLIGYLGFLLIPEEQKERFSTMGSDGTSESRLIYWEKGWEMMKEHPVLGVGYYAFPRYFEEQYAPYIDFENFRYRREVAHNSYIQVGSELGFIGLGLYLLLLWKCFSLTQQTKKLLKNNQSEELSWIPRFCTGTNMALLGYIVGSTFMSVAFYPYLYLFLMLNQSLLNVTKAELKKKTATQTPSKLQKEQYYEAS